MKPITFERKQTIEIIDADKEPIAVGSVLKHVNERDRGVVTRITLPDTKGYVVAELIGDIHIQMSDCLSCHRVTQKYADWRHIPHDEQTYEERYQSWLRRKYVDYTLDSKVPEDERRCIDGIMSILPLNIVDWESGPWPDTIEDALRFLTEYLTEKSENKTAK